MRLLISDPQAVAADFGDVVSVRAEDESGSFGILERHADLLTTLPTSVVTWRHADGRTGCCAVRHGVLSVRGGREVAIAARRAVLGDDLAQLEAAVLGRLNEEEETERRERVATLRLHTQAIRRIMQVLRGGAAEPTGFAS
jgi:F-type H+-transporting ATPase subunit epsilon